jgi:hypothetical protein
MSNQTDLVVLPSTSMAEVQARPVDVVVVDRGIDGRPLFRRWLQETPSWLTSFAIHLVLYLTILSLSAPVRMRSGGAPIVLNMSLGKDSSGSTSEIPEVLVPQSTPADDAKPLSKTDRSKSQDAPPPYVKELLARDSDATASSYKYAALTRRSHEKLRRSNNLLIRADIQSAEHDETVDRFIEYDIGRLRGAEGAQALREFQALGPEALPALVRGLNRSASLHASCPVGVIASKLISTLNSAMDPSLTRYAIDHIGDGVPQHAPHYRRLVILRDQWLRQLQEPSQRLTEMLVARGLDGKGETLELAMSFVDAPSENLLVALESSDEDLCIPALVALIQRRAKLSPREKYRAARILHSKDVDNASDDLRRLVAESTAVLDKDLAPPPTKVAPQPIAVRNPALDVATKLPQPRAPLDRGLKFDRWNTTNQPWNRPRP